MTIQQNLIIIGWNTDVFEHSNPTTKRVCINKILAMVCDDNSNHHCHHPHNITLAIRLLPLHWKSQIALFSMPHLICGTNFLFHFVNRFHLFMLISIHPSVLHFLHPSHHHSFTQNSKLTFLVNPFCHRSLTIDTPYWLPRLMGLFTVLTVLSLWFFVW